MSLLLDNLLTMHDEIRDAHQLQGMIEYVRSGGVWTMDAIKAYAAHSGDRCEPIYITRFEDGAMYVHDGHRRITSTYLGGRHFLHEKEFVLADWTYHDYMIVKWPLNYVTPHDPRKEIRLPEFFEFKKAALKMRDEFGEQVAEEYIALNRDLYCRPRTVWTVGDLAAKYEPEEVAETA